MKQQGDTYDVLIAGGGPVGATLAVALGSLSLEVGLIEPHPPGEDAAAPAYDDRCTALSWASQRVLAGLGVWPALAADATPIHRIHVSDRGHFGATRLDRVDHGVEALGQVVENRQLGRVLWQAMRDNPSISLLAPATVCSVEQAGQAKAIRVSTRPAAAADVAAPVGLSARLLVAADGARSAIRQMLGIDAEVESYSQHALVANVTPAKFHQHVAYERFTDSGPLALLPMSGARCNLVWTCWSDDAQGLLALDDESFMGALQERFGHRLGRFVRVGRRFSYPLQRVRAARLSNGRALLIGNAAHGVHPVAGQGLNLGLRDVAGLAEVIADTLSADGDHDPGTDSVLEAYAQWRSDDQARVLRFTDGLVRTFTNPAAPVAMVRGAGLIALNVLGPAREAFAREAMGMSGRQSRLARGLPLRATHPRP